MQMIRKGVLALALVATLALGVRARASDREAGSRDPGNRSMVARVISYIIQAFGDASFPPPG